MAIVWAIALAKLVFHIYFNNRYGYFRDEFDYMSCGDHLQWGYVDQPPLIPFLIHLCRAVLGDSLRSIRFIPALASSLLVVQTAVLARELGGRRYAMLLSAICAVIAPQYLSNGSLLGTNCLEPNLWMGCAYFVILAIKRNDPRYWLWFGVVAGLGMEKKYSIAVFGLGIVVGLLLTEQRRIFLNKWIWLGGLAAFLIFLPNLLWNIHYDWPFVQLMRAIKAEGRDVVFGPVHFFFQQTLLVNPLTAPIWLAGLLLLLFSARLQPYRVLGWCYLVCYIDLSSCFTERTTTSRPSIRCCSQPVRWCSSQHLTARKAGSPACQWLKPAMIIILLASGASISCRSSFPFFPLNDSSPTRNTLPFKLPVMEHAHARAACRSGTADQFGWKEIADETAVAWNRLAAEQRAATAASSPRITDKPAPSISSDAAKACPGQ